MPLSVGVIVVNRMDDGISNLLLLAVPMFVVLGLLMEMTGIARVMVNFPGELASLLATSSAMSETIPPSLVLIRIGSVTNISIAALFTGGLMPAFVAARGLVVVAWFRSRRADTGAGTRAPVSLMLRTFVIAVPGLTLSFRPRARRLGKSKAVAGGQGRNGGRSSNPTP